MVNRARRLMPRLRSLTSSACWRLTSSPETIATKYNTSPATGSTMMNSWPVSWLTSSLKARSPSTGETSWRMPGRTPSSVRWPLSMLDSRELMSRRAHIGSVEDQRPGDFGDGVVE